MTWKVSKWLWARISAAAIGLAGMAVQAASGATRQQLEKVADLALLAWPREAASPSGSQVKQQHKRSSGLSKQRPAR